MTSLDLAPGTRVDRYAIEAKLGEGGMGTVYAARHVHVGSPVVLKVLRERFAQDRDAVERFFREARAAAAAGNAHVVRITDSGITDDRRAFLVMERLDGEDLERALARSGPMTPARAVAITRQILTGIGAAHASGVVHRDLKPANIFLSPRPDGTEHVTILDFGVSKFLGDASAEVLTRTGMILGTPLYMAPEQLFGSRDVDARADLYAVGVVLYEMISGGHPHGASTLRDLLVSVASHPPRPLGSIAPSTPPTLVAVIDRAIARDPDGRFPTAAAFAHALDEAMAGRGPAAHATQPLVGSSTPRAAPQIAPTRAEPMELAPTVISDRPPPMTPVTAPGPVVHAPGVGLAPSTPSLSPAYTPNASAPAYTPSSPAPAYTPSAPTPAYDPLAHAFEAPRVSATVGSSTGASVVAGGATVLAIFTVYCLPTLLVLALAAAGIGISLYLAHRAQQRATQPPATLTPE